MFKLEAAQDNEQKLVPAWVKNNAGWWASDLTSDEEFVNALQFLVKEGIIKLQKKEINAESTFAPSIDPDLIMYQTKISSNAEPAEGGALFDLSELEPLSKGTALVLFAPVLLILVFILLCLDLTIL